MSKTFIDQCLSGDVLPSEIDDFVDRWHEHDTGVSSLHDYLGMTWEEYSYWVEKPTSLPYILFAHRKSISFQEALEAASNYSVAARSGALEANEIMLWLRKTDRIS